MNIPVLVLLGFAAWTLLILIASIGIYRWSRILTGRASMAEWRTDLPQGSDLYQRAMRAQSSGWYQRATRAHMNCVENLPVYAAIVVALMATGLQSPVIDRLAVIMLAARLVQTLVHIMLPPTNAATSLRFAFYFVQALCMIAMGAILVMHMLQ
ncbi:MAG TPA: MAPEG family protein [Aestuariivirga sp.]|nr:MAPEG family protein [Aestuariivirga sp.]